MAKKIGICRNYDGDCQKCIDKVEQERDSLDFTCEECGQPLYEVSKKAKAAPNKKLITIIAAVMLVVIIAILAIMFCGGSSSNDDNVTAPVDSTATKPDSVELNNPDTVFVERIDTILKTDTVTVKEQVIVPVKQRETAPKAVTSKESAASTKSNGKLRLSYGNYSGDLKNGHPDGMGRLTYSKSRVINQFDSKGRIAEVGDYVIGEFVNGYFVQGKHYASDGSLIETLMIGTPPSDNYDSK